MSEPNETGDLVENSTQIAHTLLQSTVSRKVFDLCNAIEQANPTGIPVELRESLAKVLYDSGFEPDNGMSSRHQFICQFALLDSAERHTGQLSPEDPKVIPVKASVKAFNERTKAIVQRFVEPFPYSQTLSQLSKQVDMRIQRFDH